MPLTPASRVILSRDQLSTNVGGEAVILSMRDGVYYGLDPVGARIWTWWQDQAPEQPLTLDAVAGRIVGEFEVGREQALADLLVLADDLLAQGLIEVVPDPDR
jgi:hypothetical protein